MTIGYRFRQLVLVLLAAGPLLQAVGAESAPPTIPAASGAIVGVVRTAGKAPAAGVTVTATRADGGAIRATVSGSDGVYSFADVAPGAWVISARAEDAAEGAV